MGFMMGTSFEGLTPGDIELAREALKVIEGSLSETGDRRPQGWTGSESLDRQPDATGLSTRELSSRTFAASSAGNLP
jgi:hypothetical protein